MQPQLSRNLDAFRNTVGKDLNNDEWNLLVATAERTQLDPVARQVFAIKRAGRMTIQTSIDGFRLIAERSTKYAGQLGPYWCGEDGVWKDVWLSKDNPAASRVGVLRSDFREPLYAIAKWSEYAQGGSMWPRMPALMLGKCAESLALRRAFPQELSGLYTAEEMGQAETVDTRTGEVKQKAIDPEVAARANEADALVAQFVDTSKREKVLELVAQAVRQPKDAALKLLASIKNKAQKTIEAQAEQDDGRSLDEQFPVDEAAP